MNRRRFVAALSCLGLSRFVSGRETASGDDSFTCSTVLESGVVPGFAGVQARVRGARGAAVAEGRMELVSEPAILHVPWRFLDTAVIRERWSSRSLSGAALPSFEELVPEPEVMRLSLLFRSGTRSGANRVAGWSRQGGVGVTIDEAWLVIPAVVLDDERRAPHYFQITVEGKVVETLPAATREISFEAGSIRGLHEIVWQRSGDPTMHVLAERLGSIQQFQVVVVDRDGSAILSYQFDLKGYSVVRAWIVDSLYQMYRNHRKGDCRSVAVDQQCYLTTATVGAMGLADDCWELRALRRFRDERLRASPAGRALVAHYGKIAPLIVNAVSSRPDALTIWRKAYWRGILPSAVLARAGCGRLAVACYTRLTRRLERYLSDG